MKSLRVSYLKNVYSTFLGNLNRFSLMQSNDANEIEKFLLVPNYNNVIIFQL